MKIFDFSKSKYSEPRKQWLKQNMHKPLTEAEFVEAWLKIKKNGCTPSMARTCYRSLKANFGFFI